MPNKAARAAPSDMSATRHLRLAIVVGAGFAFARALSVIGVSDCAEYCAFSSL